MKLYYFNSYGYVRISRCYRLVCRIRIKSRVQILGIQHLHINTTYCMAITSSVVWVKMKARRSS